MTDRITERILPLRDFRRGNNMLFELCELGGRCPAPWLSVWGDEIHEQDDIRTTVNAVVDLINESRHPFEIAQSPLNYEDLVYAMDRLWRLESGRAFDPLAAVTRKALLSRLSSRPGLLRALQQVLSISIHCMIDLVSKALEVDRPSWTHLQFLSELIREIGPANVTVLTTNHDTLLEHYFENLHLSVEDGFSVPETNRDIPRWSPRLLDQEHATLRLLKVHGSIDWHWLTRRDRVAEMMARGSVERLEEWTNPNAERHSVDWDVEDRSVILVGSYNKAERYASGLYWELFSRARREVMGARRILVCGYGFRDEVINMMLVDWNSGTPDGQLIVVARRGFDELTAKLHPWMKEWFVLGREEGVLIPIENTCVEDLSWQNHIRPHMVSVPAPQ